MKLPNADRAEVAIEKLRDYCLNAEHPRGRHKARVFLSALGIASNEAEWLRQQIEQAAITQDAQPTEKDGFGQRYVLDFVATRGTRRATVRSCWIVRAGESHPRFTSCYIL